MRSRARILALNPMVDLGESGARAFRRKILLDKNAKAYYILW
jgi:hypothetical protein